MTVTTRSRVILLPGGVMPVGPAYDGLLSELGPDIDAHAKDLEIYAADVPPPDFSLALEVAGIDRLARDAGFERFHLVGYSAGGAAVLEYASRRPDRVLSLALLEPAFAGWQGMTREERNTFERFRPLIDVTGSDLMPRFAALQLAPNVEPPARPSGPPPHWMTKRPAGLRALIRTFLSSDLDLAPLRRFDRPVWFALGGRSNPDLYGRMADRLAMVFADFTIERFEDRHHFDPPHRIEPARVAASLRALWARAEQPRDQAG
jgi:pimeloyl-ACP methyl ester carboxylesterase